MDNQTTTTIKSDVKWPAPKKNNTLKVLGGILAVLLVAGIAVGAYFVSTRVGSQQAIAPTAPESEPLAAVSDGSCTEAERDVKASNQIKFGRAGTIYTYTQNIIGSVRMVRTSPASPAKSFSLTSTVSTPARVPKVFTVAAGEVYTVTVKWANETAPGYGWIKRKAAYTCGPVKHPTADGKKNCGANLGIKPLISLASTQSTLTGITAGAINANVQCWGDKLVGDWTQDYDYNDGVVVFGYKKAPPGACKSLKVFKKNANGTYQSTPIATSGAQLKIGDKLKLQCTANRSKLLARFKVQIDGVDQANPLWRMFVPFSATSTIYTFSDYTIAKNGAYKFISMVSTKPPTVTLSDSLTLEAAADLDAQRDFNLSPEQGDTDSANDAAPDESEEIITSDSDITAE